MTSPPSPERVIVLMPSREDGRRTAALLAEARVETTIVDDVPGLCEAIRAGGATVLTTDDVLASDTQGYLAATLRAEPAWSSMPFVVIAREGRSAKAQERAPEAIKALVVVERPVRTASLLSVLASSLRARTHQYQMRDAIAARERQAEALAAQAAELADQREKLRAADRRKDDFLATLAHELRNPLAPLRTGVEVLAARAKESSDARALAVMGRQLTHMVRLIDDLLDISRITRGKLELKRESLALGGVLDTAVEATRPAFAAAGHELVVDIEDRDVVLDADPTRIAQVVGNLLSNAAKYTPPKGRIVLGARRTDDGELEIAVRDSGVGLAPGRLDDVFEMFNQVEEVIDRAQGGLGIGLALVKQFVEMHGGTVHAESEGLGQGSRFVVRLPLADEPKTGKLAVLGEASPARERRRVLVVDDNVDAAELLAMMLEQQGYETLTAEDGPSALRLACDRAPDLVVLDIGLPGMSGYDVARAMRAEPRTRHVGLVALTGWGSREDKERAKDAGFDVHLTKPVDGHGLSMALGEVERAVVGRARAASA